MEVIDRPRPTPGPAEALVEVAYTGLCGSDAGIYEFEDAFEVMDLPTVIGHEYAGTVVEVGADVHGLSPGDTVVERPIRNCGDCFQCRTGVPNLCADAAITGVHHDGAWAGYIAVPAESLHAIPDDMELWRAALTEPTSVATRAVTHNSRVRPGDNVLVEGPGPIGLLTAQLAAAQGGDVVVSGVGSDAAHRLPLAAELGARAVDVTETDLETVVAAETDGIGFDVVFDTTGHPSGIENARDAVRKGGQVVVVGLPDTIEVDFTPFVRAEIDLQCSYTATWHEFERAVRVLDEGVIDAEAMVDRSLSLLDVDAAFEAFLAGEVCKPLFDASELRA